MAETKYILEMKNISKVFPGVQALKGVNLQIKPGEVHALIGENGAGKSTLMKCLIGIYSPTEGTIHFDGKLVQNYNTSDALKMGISMIHQELSPVEHRSIMENIWLGREPLKRFGLVDHKKMYNQTKELLERLELDVEPDTLMVDLTVAKMQMVEIAKAISYDAKLIIMDEPTSALTNKEVEQLFKIIRRLKEEGKAIIYISHKLDEIFTICDRVTVLRDGEYIGTRDIKDIDVPTLIRMMVGRDINDMYPKETCELGEVKLEVENLSSNGAFENVSFSVRKGEILGVAGLVGAGRTELVETIFGLRKKTKGRIKIDGKEVDIKTPMDAIKAKIGLLTEDRRLNGIIPVLSVADNMIIANLNKYGKSFRLFNHKEAVKDVNEYVEDIRIVTPSIEQRIMNLSGGNQQKVLIARWLLTEPEILIMDEPTRGIDVGAKAEIYKLMGDIVKQGKCIIMISSELPEILGMSDRIMVMHEGRVSAILDNSKDLTQEEVMSYATGQKIIEQS